MRILKTRGVLIDGYLRFVYRNVLNKLVYKKLYIPEIYIIIYIYQITIAQMLVFI